MTPHLSPARRPAGPRHLMTKCQNSPLTLSDAHIHVIVSFFYLTLGISFHGNIQHMAETRTGNILVNIQPWESNMNTVWNLLTQNTLSSHQQRRVEHPMNLSMTDSF